MFSDSPKQIDLFGHLELSVWVLLANLFCRFLSILDLRVTAGD